MPFLEDAGNHYPFPQIDRFAVGAPIKVNRRFLKIFGVPGNIPPAQIEKAMPFKGELNRPFPDNLFHKRVFRTRVFVSQIGQRSAVSDGIDRIDSR